MIPVVERRPLFTVRSLAAFLQVSERQVRYLIARRRIRSLLIGGQRRFRPEDVDEFLERHVAR